MRKFMSGVRFDAPGAEVEMWKRRSDEMRLSAPCRDAIHQERPNVLLAEDDDEFRALLTQVMHGAGYRVIPCSDGWSLFRHLASYFFFAKYDECVEVDLVVADIRLPGPTGLQILERSHTLNSFPPMILMTAFGDEHTHADARRFGAAALYDKPFDINELLLKIKELLPPTRPGRSR